MTKHSITSKQQKDKYDQLAALYMYLVNNGMTASEAARQVDAAMIADMRRRGIPVVEADL